MVMPVPSRLISKSSGDDPLDLALRPPLDETPEQREIRVAREEEARRVSAAIDASIKAERQARKKKRIVRLLLLGQSESGKSTTLRQFQRLYTPTAFREERILWRAVIQLNIVRSIRTILEALAQSPPPLPTPYRSYSHPNRSQVTAFQQSPEPSPHSSPRAHPQPYSQSISSSYVHSQKRRPSNPIPPFDLDNGLHNESDNEDESPSDTEFHISKKRSNPSLSAPISASPPSYSPLVSLPNQNHSINHSSAITSNVINITHTTIPPNHAAYIDTLKTRLTPLQHVESLLIAKLVPPNEEEATHLPSPSRISHGHSHSFSHPQYAPSVLSEARTANSSSTSSTSYWRSQQEIFIRPGSQWKGALARARVSRPPNVSSSAPNSKTASQSSSTTEEDILYSPPFPPAHSLGKSKTQILAHSGKARPSSAGNTGLETPDEIQEVLHTCKEEMMSLWEDEWVREVLHRKKIRLEEGPGFFLNDLERVTGLKYMPSDDDVLRARLKTVGASEYKFEMEVSAGRDSGTEWRIIDVGGSRSQRLTWVPFFDDVDAIIFLAPISGFDQVLAEDRTVNRLEDSVLLWKAVCSNKLLASVDLVLFLNKCDILETKLNSGIQLARYVRSYGDRENSLDAVSKYLRSKFSAIHREYSPNPRKFYVFCTSVTDTTTTAGIIASVRDMVIRQHLKQSKLL